MNVLILGASYGSLLGVRLALAGHDVTLVCLPAEADTINADGAVVRMPVKGRDGLVEINSRDLSGKLRAATTADVTPAGFDLVVLAMQEPQYRSPGVRELTQAVAEAKKPCMSIMNMPPLPFLRRIPGIDAAAIRDCYADATVWDAFEPGLMTLCSPDPQAFRPPTEAVNVLQVRLPTNFKSAPFADPAHTALLTTLETDIEASRFVVDGEALSLPVKLKVFGSIYVPLAKWAMLMAGNFRCIKDDTVISIRDAVHTDLDASRNVYEWVVFLCIKLGAARVDLVPFEKYAAAGDALQSPSSVARALANGAQNVERVDKLIQTLGRGQGLSHPEIDRTVSRVEAWLAKNRAAAKP
ncbi:MAG: hypothetical protein SH859_16230 [Hyphomicrobium aestuarii]|nr:hypothetical protein [Hyphomicrobium aestuarii]